MQLVGNSVFLKTLGLSLFNSLWQMALLWLCYMLIIYASKNLSARVKHGLAFFFLAVGSTWFFTGFFYFYISGFQPGINHIDPVAGIVTRGAILTFGSGSRLFDKYLPYCSIIYMGVLFFQFTRYSKYYLHSCNLRNTGLKKASPSLRLFVEEKARQLGIGKNVGIWLSAVADSPMTLGFLKSVILIPIASLNHLSTQQVESILLHELAHIKRNDYFLNLLVTLTGILFFFNPFCRLLIGCIRKEAENSCDDLVMQFRYDPHMYVTALLSLEKTRVGKNLAMEATGKSNLVLLNRVRRITGHTDPVSLSKPKLLVILSICIMAYFSASYQPGKTSSFPQAKPVFPIAATKIKQEAFQSFKTPVAEKYSSKKPDRKTGKTLPRQITRSENQLENNLVLVSNADQEKSEVTEKNEISVALRPEEEKYYSISQENENPQPPQEENTGSFPFVPNSSFVYKITEDSTNQIQRRQYYDQKLLEESSRKLKGAVESIDWKKIDRLLTAKGKKLTIKVLKSALYKSFIKTETQFPGNEGAESFDEADEQRMRGDIRLELKALGNTKTKSPQEIQKLRQDLIREQTRLYQQSLKKQRELLKNMEDEIKKKSKIVYI